jgi:uncharacterized protein with LGFP repeats
MSSLDVAVIHHTASTNSYSEGTAAAQIRSVYAYHTASLGWNDIGYNFLVDRYGRIYEGRAGGVDRAVQGAHAGGFNNGTVGHLGAGQLPGDGGPGGPDRGRLAARRLEAARCTAATRRPRRS